MADEQLRGLTMDSAIIDELQVPIPEQWRTEFLAEWVPQTTEYGQPFTRDLLQQASRIIRARVRDTDTQEIYARRDSMNYFLRQMGIAPAKTKPEIKRGNPWVQ